MDARNLILNRDDEPKLQSISIEKAVQRRTPRCQYVAFLWCVVKNFRAISTSQLHALQRFHPWPINVVVYYDSSPLRD